MIFRGRNLLKNMFEIIHSTCIDTLPYISIAQRDLTLHQIDIVLRPYPTATHSKETLPYTTYSRDTLPYIRFIKIYYKYL